MTYMLQLKRKCYNYRDKELILYNQNYCYNYRNKKIDLMYSKISRLYMYY